MPNFSQITIAGHLGKDAETKTLNSGQTVTEFSIAVTPYKSETAMWFNCSMWGKRGESVAQYLTKGGAALVTGTFTVREYEGKNGVGYSLDLNVSELALLGEGKRNEEKPAGNDNGNW